MQVKSTFKPDEPILVLQREVAIIDNNGSSSILATYGAGPCIIVALFA